MKKIKSLLLLLPLVFSLGACGSGEDGPSIDLNSYINESDAEDFVKDFLYDNSVANMKLKELASTTGYSFDIRIERETLPDDNNSSLYFDIILSGKDNLTWATVNQKNKQNETINTYYAVLEEDTEATYVSNGDGWYLVTGSFPLPYSISDLKSLLIISGQYIPLLTITGIVKTRTISINRECIKYKLVKEPDELTILVDRKTQILTELIDIQYTSTGVSKNLFKMNAFNEFIGEAPSYK